MLAGQESRGASQGNDLDRLLLHAKPAFIPSLEIMQRLKRVFNVEVEVCEHCGGHVKVIASIEDPAVIERILKHLKRKTANTDTSNHHTLPPERAPPQSGLFDPSQTRLFD